MKKIILLASIICSSFNAMGETPTTNEDNTDFNYIVVFKTNASEKVMFCENPQVGNEDHINLGRGENTFYNAMDAVEFLMDNGYKFKCQVGNAEKYVLYKVVEKKEKKEA